MNIFKKRGNFMKRKIIAVCILLAICLSGAYTEQFYDGGVNVFVQYAWNKQELSPNWKEFCEKRLLDTCSMMKIYADYPLKKLSNDEVKLINKALQRFELGKDEIYTITMVSNRGTYRECKLFCVLITNINEENYWWDWCGREGMSLFL